MNTGTLLGNDIKHLFLNCETSTRTYQEGAFENDTLKRVFFMTPNAWTVA